MTSLAIAIPNPSSRFPGGAAGAGEDATLISDRIAEAAQHLLNSATGGEASIDAIEQIAALELEAAVDDWDSRGSQAVDPLSIRHSMRFVALMPAGVPAPHVGVDPDGSVSFDWQTGDAAFSVSFAANQTLTYAGIYALARQRGVEYFSDEIPAAILEGIRRALAGH